jgi:TolA-binding protein
MAVMCRWVLAWTLLLAGGVRLLASSDESTDFKHANADLLGNSFERAEAEFGAFIQTHTNSSRLAEAVLYQAEARLKLGKPAGAIELLSARLPQAGKWTDPYLLYLGEAFFQSGDYRKASDTFGQLLQQFRDSTNGLRAVVQQASACSRLQQWPRVIELLQQPPSVFQTAIRARPADAFTQRGLLLLSEAWLRQSNAPQKFASAEAALLPLANVTLKPAVGWQRQELLCRILQGGGHTNEALQATTNLLALAAQAGSRELLARSYDLRASLLEGRGDWTNAIAAYTNNIAADVPDDLQRGALLQSTKLFLAHQKTADAIQILERFVGQYSNAPAADEALLGLGELHLGQFIATLDPNSLDALPAKPPGPTNAIARLQAVVERFPQSPRTAKARLDLGWCFWLQGNLINAATNFEAAAQHLAPSTDQATAYFKLADTQFRLGQLAEGPARLSLFQRALTNYSQVLQKAAALPEARAALEAPALYQIVYAGLPAGDLAAVTNALTTLLERYPEDYRTAPAVLLAGQALGRRGDMVRAREILLGYATHTTNTLPRVHLALARTWEEEGNWTNAIRHYSQLLSNCTNPEFRAEAEYYRAQATWRAGDLSNALVLYTNFVAHFNTHPKAPIAQFWVASHYFNQGNSSAAQLNFQQLCEDPNWRSSELVYQARMMAGRAAFQQQLWKGAVSHFTDLTSNVHCPSNVWMEAMFAWGDCELSQLSKERSDTNNTVHLDQAVKLFSSIYENYPTGPQALLALGKKAEALVQYAQHSGDNQHYTNALYTYQLILTNSAADATLRSLAKLGMAVALKWQADQKSGSEQAALLRQALDQCLDVARGTLLGPNEKGDPNLTLRAGDMGIGLAESLQAWPEAISLCQELSKLFPSLSARYQDRAKSLAVRQSNLTRN